jgi:predicted ArsR family transcriptional regulator
VAENVHMGRGANAIPRLKGLCFKAEATLAGERGISERTIRRHFGLLQDEGLIEVLSYARGLGNGIRLMWPSLPGSLSALSGNSRPKMSGKGRARSKPTKDPNNGQFCPAKTDILVSTTGQDCPRTLLKDSTENLLERAFGEVNDQTRRDLEEARRRGDKHAMAEAIRRMGAGKESTGRVPGATQGVVASVADARCKMRRGSA